MQGSYFLAVSSIVLGATAVRSWLAAPSITRGLSERGPESFMDGGSPAEWFDLIVHHQELTPAEPGKVFTIGAWWQRLRP
jgi:hypothetical protein